MNKYKLSLIFLLLSVSCAPSFAGSFLCNEKIETGIIKNINMFTTKEGKIQMGIQINNNNGFFTFIDASNSATTPMLRFAAESKLLGRKLNFCIKSSINNNGVSGIIGMEVVQ